MTAPRSISRAQQHPGAAPGARRARAGAALARGLPRMGFRALRPRERGLAAPRSAGFLLLLLTLAEPQPGHSWHSSDRGERHRTPWNSRQTKPTSSHLRLCHLLARAQQEPGCHPLRQRSGAPEQCPAWDSAAEQLSSPGTLHGLGCDSSHRYTFHQNCSTEIEIKDTTITHEPGHQQPAPGSSCLSPPDCQQMDKYRHLWLH